MTLDRLRSTRGHMASRCARSLESGRRSRVAVLEGIGCELRVRETDWHQHRMPRIEARDVHVQVFTLSSAEIDRSLVFRDLVAQK